MPISAKHIQHADHQSSLDNNPDQPNNCSYSLKSFHEEHTNHVNSNVLMNHKASELEDSN